MDAKWMVGTNFSNSGNRIESYMNFERLSGLFFVFELLCRFCRICRIFSAVSVFVCSDVVFGFCIFWGNKSYISYITYREAWIWIWSLIILHFSCRIWRQVCIMVMYVIEFWENSLDNLDMQPARMSATPYLHAALRALAGTNLFFTICWVLRKQFR